MLHKKQTEDSEGWREGRPVGAQGCRRWRESRPVGAQGCRGWREGRPVGAQGCREWHSVRFSELGFCLLSQIGS